VVVASPSDISEERETLANRIVHELNRGIAADRDLRLDVYRWETDAQPGFHVQGPQEAVDSVLRIEDCDILIAIFWHVFGTPTRGAASGTEHEFNTAYNSWKRTLRPDIKIYFNQAPFTPKKTREATQWRRVLRFKEKIAKDGLYQEYNGPLEFERLVREHLTKFILQNFRPIDEAYDYADYDLKRLDTSWDLARVMNEETIVIVTGCNASVELLDRPVANFVRKEIDRRGSPPSYRRAVVIGDLWWQQGPTLRKHPVISIGGPAANSLTSDLINSAGVTLDEVRPTELPSEDGFPRLVIAGLTAAQTRLQAERFVEDPAGLVAFLQKCWP
jgi:hypothetical protein